MCWRQLFHLAAPLATNGRLPSSFRGIFAVPLAAVWLWFLISPTSAAIIVNEDNSTRAAPQKIPFPVAGQAITEGTVTLCETNGGSTATPTGCSAPGFQSDAVGFISDPTLGKFGGFDIIMMSDCDGFVRDGKADECGTGFWSSITGTFASIPGMPAGSPTIFKDEFRFKGTTAYAGGFGNPYVSGPGDPGFIPTIVPPAPQNTYVIYSDCSDESTCQIPEPEIPTLAVAALGLLAVRRLTSRGKLRRLVGHGKRKMWVPGHDGGAFVRRGSAAPMEKL